MKLRTKASFCLAASLFLASNVHAGTFNYRNTVLSDNPLLYYEFDEVSGTTALNSGFTGASHNGTINGTVHLNQSSFAQGGRAYRFEGTNVLLEPDGHVLVDPLPSPLAEWTIEAWINWNPAKNNTANIFAVDQAGWNDDVLFGIAPETTDISPAGELAIIQQGAPGTTRDMVSVPLSSGQWHHVVATGSTSAGELKLYIDGVLVGVDNQIVNGLIMNGAGGLGANPKLAIGARPDSLRGFNGLIDELAVYNYVLDAQTIAAHYAAGIVPEPASLALLAAGGLMLVRRRR